MLSSTAEDGEIEVRISVGGKLNTFKVLCEQYQPSIKRDPSYPDYLNKIGHIFFGIPLPRAQPQGLFAVELNTTSALANYATEAGNILQSFFSGLDEESDTESEQGPQPSTSSRQHQRQAQQSSLSALTDVVFLVCRAWNVYLFLGGVLLVCCVSQSTEFLSCLKDMKIERRGWAPIIMFLTRAAAPIKIILKLLPRDWAAVKSLLKTLATKLVPGMRHQEKPISTYKTYGKNPPKINLCDIEGGQQAANPMSS
uniref:Uncharacterized protein n=1 Tax=Timema shepardi TaxID=629360 RepID=A0A7R9B6S8_TIMSH|nr:unnamed protein product [Timema shepardi]